MDFTDIFKNPTIQPQPPGEVDTNKASLAVVASGKDGCAVIWHVGYHVKIQIEELGSNNEEIFESDPPLGISVFEGYLSGGGARHTMDGLDYDDVYLSGTFRSPTPGEFVKIAQGVCPWDENDWLVAEAP